MLGRSDALREVFKAIGAVSATRAAVLIRGESGTGKELVARAIHKASADAAQPFVPVNCSAFATELLESELFGHARGSFTGAVADRMGRFELAGSGTLFLDEIGELSAAMQVKLLRVLQDRVFERVGDARPLRLEARVVAATHRDLARMVREGAFREDLYYRLRVVELIVPPLRERKEDIPVLVTGLLPRLNRSLRTGVRFVSQEAMELLQRHSWPGNVRELENALTGACVAAKGEMLAVEHLPPLLGPEGAEQGPASQRGGGPASQGPASQRGLLPGARRGGPVPVMPAVAAGEGPADEALLSLWEVERNHVVRVLAVTAWNKRRACEILQITRPTLDRKIKDFGLEKPATARGDA
jgi:two-component system response regulator AtoC